jgi:hypothetical protein
MCHDEQHLLGVLHPQRPPPDAPSQRKHDEVCVSRGLINQNTGLEHPHGGLLHSPNQTAAPGMRERSDGLEAPVGLQGAVEQALLQSYLLGVSRRSARLLSCDWPRDCGRPLGGSIATNGQTSPCAVPSGEGFPELIQAALAAKVLPVRGSDLLLRNAGKTGRGGHAGHQVHPGEVEDIVLGTFVCQTAQRLENILDSSGN